MKNVLKWLGLLPMLLVAACSDDKSTAGTTEEGNAIAENLSSSVQESSSSIVSGSSSSTTSTPMVLWNGAEGIFQINTGVDNGSEKSGYWFAYSDNADGGASNVVWPVTLGNEYSEDMLDPVIDYCGGICGTVRLDNGSAGGDAFAGFGFNVAGEDDYGVPVAGDVTEWDGICISYTSDFDIEVELSLGDSLDAALNYDVPYVRFPKSTTDYVYSRCATWSDFVQKNSSSISGEEAATQLVSVRFKFVGETGSEGFVNIRIFGSYYDLEEEDYPINSMYSSSSVESLVWQSSSSVEYTIADLDTVLNVYNGATGMSKIAWYELDDPEGFEYGHMAWPWDSVYYSDGAWQKEVTKACGGMCGLSLYDIYLNYESQEDCYSGIGFEVSEEMRESGGVCVALGYSGFVHIVLRLEDSSASDGIKKAPSIYAYPKFDKPSVHCFKWDDFYGHNYGWPSATPVEHTGRVKSVEILVDLSRQLNSYFNVYGIGTYKDITGGEILDVDWKHTDEIIEPLYYTEYKAQDICGNLFCPFLQAVIAPMIHEYYPRIAGVPGHDFDNYGQWFIFADTAKSAKIDILSTDDLRTEYLYDGYTQIVDLSAVAKCHGFCGSYQIGDEGSEVGFGFHVGMVDQHGSDSEEYEYSYTPTVVDATALIDGLCLVYMSDTDIALQLNPSSAEVILPAAPNGNLMDVKWSDFENGEELAKKMIAFKFMFRGEKGDTGYFNISSLGNVGTCVGIPDYSEKPRAK